MISYIYAALIIAIFVLIVSALARHGHKYASELQTKHAKVMETKPYCYYAFTDIELRQGDTVTYLNYADPAIVTFQDVKDGDFCETRYAVINFDDIKTFATAAQMEANRSVSTVAIASIMVDRNNLVTIKSLGELPGIGSPLVGVGFTSFKELKAPTVKELGLMYK